jgi:HAD superfamily hydrolase (TIGR01549 family)
MSFLSSKSVILWDFDGVLMQSNAVRDQGFEEVLRDFPAEQVAALLAYHRANGGLSRYVKFRYFFEEVRKEPVSEERVLQLASSFSEIMRKLLTNRDLLIEGTLRFVQEHHRQIPMHIVSGSDGNELRYLCGALGIADYFRSIDGSPTPKKQLVAEILSSCGYDKAACVLVGDSINDYEAAAENGIHFLAYGNQEIVPYSSVDDFLAGYS